MDISGEGVYTVTPAAYDANGQVVEDIYLSSYEVKVTIPVNQSKRVPLVCDTQGWPADGYVVGSVRCTPEYIDVVGDEALLAEFTEVVLPAVNVTGREEPIEIDYSVKYFLPVNIRLKDETADKVKVTVDIIDETRRAFTIDSENVAMEGEVAFPLTASFEPQDVSIVLVGTQQALDAIEESQLTATLPISGLDQGEHSVKAEISLPENVRLYSDVPEILVTVKGPEAELPQETQTEEPPLATEE